MIEEISYQNMKDMGSVSQPFEVIGRLIPEYRNEQWSYTEQLFENAYEKCYPTDDNDAYCNYIDNPDQTIFFNYEGNKCVGQIIVKKNWNRYALLEEIAVANKYRGKGIGAQLIKKAIEWAKHKNLCGLMLETQDTNPIACRFYNKMGFKIGGVDDMLYASFETSSEKAIFWYFKFNSLAL